MPGRRSTQCMGPWRPQGGAILHPVPRVLGMGVLLETPPARARGPYNRASGLHGPLPGSPTAHRQLPCRTPIHPRSPSVPMQACLSQQLCRPMRAAGRPFAPLQRPLRVVAVRAQVRLAQCASSRSCQPEKAVHWSRTGGWRSWEVRRRDRWGCCLLLALLDTHTPASHAPTGPAAAAPAAHPGIRRPGRAPDAGQRRRARRRRRLRAAARRQHRGG